MKREHLSRLKNKLTESPLTSASTSNSSNTTSTTATENRLGRQRSEEEAKLTSLRSEQNARDPQISD